jgi:hypothetical protein
MKRGSYETMEENEQAKEYFTDDLLTKYYESKEIKVNLDGTVEKVIKK